MKLQILIPVLLLASCAVAQPTGQYSSKNKKAIKAYEAAETCYGTMDKTGKKDGDCIIKNFTKAFEADPNFMEAYLLLAQYYIDVKKNKEAIEVLKKSHKVNPTFFVNSWFLLGELEFKTGNYAGALAALKEYETLVRGNIPNDMAADLDKMRASCDFAVEAMKKPVTFEPVNLGPGVNTRFPEYFPTITGDDEMLLFTRRIPDQAAPMGEQEDFFYSIKIENKWNKAQSISNKINTYLNEGAPTLSADGSVLIFTACDLMGMGDYGEHREGLGSCDLFYSTKYNGVWEPAQNLGSNINSSQWEGQPSYSADGKDLYYIKRGKGNATRQNGEIVVSHLIDGVWSAPERLPDYINTPDHECSVLIHPDGQTLYFSSNGHVGFGGFDLYMCRKQPNGKWGKPVNLGYPINTSGEENSLLVSSSGEVAFFASDRPGGYGELDLYSFKLDESIRPVYTTYMKGVVYDSISKAKLEARFILTDLETGKPVQVAASDEKGEFFQNIATNKEYALSVEKKGYHSYSEHFKFGDDGVPKDKVFLLNIPMIPVGTADAPIVLKNVFFDVDKFDLLPKSFVELDRLVDFLTKNPDIKIELGGHTDSDGDDAHNMTLSDNRAKAVMNYVVSKGISKDRLKAKGYGETKPVKPNDTKENKAQNRRTEYKIIK
ncbi:MAG TPA: OmpA family protein [Flavobacteriales bacterium]|nr:OmpA family protein [Flavobacteriales bacterium]